MGATVATPLERQFGQIAGVTQMSSVSSLGSTVITLQFDLNRNIDGAAQDVQAAITAAGPYLPKNLTYAADLQEGEPGGLADPDRGGDLRKRSRCRRWTISPRTSSPRRFRRLPAYRSVAIGGQQRPAVRVQVDPVEAHRARSHAGRRARSADQRHDVDAAKGTMLGRSKASPSTHQRSADASRAIQRCDRRLSQWRAGAHARHRPSDRRAARRDAWARCTATRPR